MKPNAIAVAVLLLLFADASAHDPSIAIDRLKPGELQAWFDSLPPSEKQDVRRKFTVAELKQWGIDVPQTKCNQPPPRREAMVRGKFKLAKITENAGAPGKQLMFSAVCNDGTPENERFHRYTPTGTLEMYVDSPGALEQFKLGTEYYLDFTPCK